MAAPDITEVAPGTMGLPIVGNLFAFARDPLGYLTEGRQLYGDVAVSRMAGRRVAMVCRPELVDEILVKHWRSTHKNDIYRRLIPLLGHGLVTAEGEHWRRNRKRAAPSFSPRQIAGYADAMVRCARDQVATLQPGHERDLHHDMMELTQRIVLETVFGADLDVDTDVVAEVIDVVMAGFERESRSLLRMVPPGVPTPSRRRTARSIARLDAVIDDLIAARRAAGPGDDLLSRLLDARDEDGAGLDDRGLRDEAVTLFVAGHETTATTLTYTWCWLALHPEWFERLRDEVRAHLGDRPATAADAHHLPVTKACIQESMRLHPPVWGFGRQVVEPFEAGGYTFPVGLQIVFPVYVMHRDPTHYPNPDTYDPQRWLDGLEERLPRGAWLPFGGGPRVCIGNHFAMMEAILCLAEQARSIRYQLMGGFPELHPTITLRPRGRVPARIA